MPTLFHPFDSRITGAIAAGTHIEHKVLAQERELEAHRWFAYRFLSPFSATDLFYRTYLEHRRRYVGSYIDIGLLPLLRERPLLALKPADITQVWKARQRADSIGLPYGAYLEHSLEFWNRRSGEGYAEARSKRPPRYNQLHFSKKSEFAWMAEFNKRLLHVAQVSAMALAEVPELDASCFVGEAAQHAARAYIRSLCELATASWEDLVRKWCYEYPVMSVLSMRRLMPRDVMVQVIDRLRSSRPSRRPLPTVAPDLRPSCFAVPGAHSSAADRCGSCRFAASCKTATREVLDVIVAATGSDDPRRAQLRKPANVRQRKLDAKKRAARKAASVVASAGS